MASITKRRITRWIVGVVVVLVAIGVGGPFVYFHFIQADPPPKPSLATTPVPSSVPGTKRAPLAGKWKVASGTIVDYRIKETVLGQSGTAVGKTNSVTGSLTITGTKVTAASFSVDMTTVASDESQRDDQFQNRIMDTASFPTATFTLTSPIDLAPVPKDGALKTYAAAGRFTLHGTTNDVNFGLTARRTGNVIAVQGDEPITFADYGIDNPSGGPASVGDSGHLEFVLQFQPAA